jgi:membrane associated rhomboid family serine protease
MPLSAGRFQFRRVGAQAHEPWFRLGSVDVTTTVIITALCVLSFFVYALYKPFVFELGLIPGSVGEGKLWRILTWPLANFPSIPEAISIAAFWYFGSKIEQIFGRRRFLALALLLTIVPGIVVASLGEFADVRTSTSRLAASLTGLSAVGIGALGFAMFLAFAIENPDAPFFFGIKAWILAAVYLAIRLLQIIGDRATGQLIVLIVGLLLLVTTMRAWGAAQSLPRFPKLPLVDKIRTTGKKPIGTSGSKQKKRGGAKLRSVSNAESPPKTGSTAWPAGAIRQEEVDRLLEKIASSGISSLSAAERETLDLASKNLRDRRE